MLVVAGHILDKSEKKDQAKKERLDLKGKTVETVIADNKQAQQENDEWKKKYDELDNKIKKRDEEIKKFQNKLTRKTSYFEANPIHDRYGVEMTDWSKE